MSEGYSREYGNDPAFRTQAPADGRVFQEYYNDPRGFWDSALAGYGPDPRVYQDSSRYVDPRQDSRQDSRGWGNRGYSDARGYPDQRSNRPDYQNTQGYADPRSYANPRVYPDPQTSQGYADPRSSADPRRYPEQRYIQGYSDPRSSANPRGYSDPRNTHDYADPRSYGDPRGYPDPRHTQDYADPRSSADPRRYPDQRDTQGYSDPRSSANPRGYPDSRNTQDYADPRSYAFPRGYPDHRNTQGSADPRSYEVPRRYPEQRDTQGYSDPRREADPRGYAEQRDNRGYPQSRGYPEPSGDSEVWYREPRGGQDARGYDDPRSYEDRGAPRNSSRGERSYEGRSAQEQREHFGEDRRDLHEEKTPQNRSNSREEAGEYTNGVNGGGSVASSSILPTQLFGSTLVKESKEVDAAQELEGKTVGIFFASTKDPESKSFLPLLTQAYQRVLVSRNVEIVWVPMDTQQKDFMQYIRRIPWLALPRDTASSAVGRRLVRKCKQETVPHLVFIDPFGRLLSRDGIKRIRSDKTCRNFPWTNKTFAEAVGSEFLRGRQMVTIDSFEGKLIGILFASEEQASVWYGPGNSFASTLAKQYKAALRRGHEFEVIFCSADGNEKAFKRQYKEIVDNTSPPWLAIPFADSGRRKALAFTLRVSKSPQLVIVDEHGRILNGDAVTDVSRDPSGSRFPWARQLVRELKSGWDAGPRFTAMVCCFIESFTFSQQEEVTSQLEVVSQRYHDSVHEMNEEPMYTFFAARRNSAEAARLRQICKLPRSSPPAVEENVAMSPKQAVNEDTGFRSGGASAMSAPEDEPREKAGVAEAPETQQSLPPLDRMPEEQAQGGVQEWTMELDRSTGGQLGIALNTTSLFIDRVVDTGLVKDFNNSNPDMSVRAGDKVLQVNGKSEPKEVIMECKKAQVLVFKLQRQEAPGKAEDKRTPRENKEMERMPKAWLVFLELHETHISYSTLETPRISAEAVEEFIEDVEQGRIRSSKLKREQAGIPAAGIDQNATACRTCTRLEWLQAIMGGGSRRSGNPSRRSPRSRSKSRDRNQPDEWGFSGFLA